MRNLHGLDGFLAVLASQGGKSLSESDARDILLAANGILHKDDDAAGPDVSCQSVSYEMGRLSTFPNRCIDRREPKPDNVDLLSWADPGCTSTTTSDGMPMSCRAGAIDEIHNLKGHVKVVRTIWACETIKAGLEACADEARQSVIVTSWVNDLGGYGQAMTTFDPESGIFTRKGSKLITTANIWLHELGHLSSLKHRTPAESNSCSRTQSEIDHECSGGVVPLMCGTLDENFRVCQAECDSLDPP